MPNTVSDPIITTLGKCMNFEGNDKQVAINKYPIDKRVSCEDMIQAQHKWLKIIETKGSRKAPPSKSKINVRGCECDEHGNEIKSIAMSYCGKWSSQSDPTNGRYGVRVQYRDNGTLSLKGTVIKCGSPNCYWCSKEVAKKESNNISKIMRVAIIEGYEMFFLTFTHKKHSNSEKNCDITSGGHKAIYQAIRDMNKWSVVDPKNKIELRTVTEPTFSRNNEWIEGVKTKSIHSHIHGILFVPTIDKNFSMNIRQYLSNRWTKTMAKLGSYSKTENGSTVGFDMVKIESNSHSIDNVADYISKKIMFNDNIKYEMTHQHKKKSKNRNIVELLRDIVLYEDKQDIYMYRTWVKKTQGKWNYRKTSGIDEWLTKANIMEKMRHEENARKFLELHQININIIDEYMSDIEEWIQMTINKDEQKESKVLYEIELHPHLWNTVTIQGNHYKLLKVLRLYWKIGKYQNEFDKLVALNKTCDTVFIETLHKRSLWWRELDSILQNV